MHEPPGPAPRRRHGGHVVWVREHFASESIDGAHRVEAGRHESRCTRARSISGRDRIRSSPKFAPTQWGADRSQFDLVSGDTSITPDCGKTSASRQTFVTGKAAHMAGTKLRGEILKLAGACEDALHSSSAKAAAVIRRRNRRRRFACRVAARRIWLRADCGATFDPPTSPLDQDGQGVPMRSTDSARTWLRLKWTSNLARCGC